MAGTGGVFVRHAVLRLKPDGYDVLDWQRGSLDQTDQAAKVSG